MIMATKLNNPLAKKKSQILRHTLTGKLYKKRVIYHLWSQKEFGTSLYCKCSNSFFISTFKIFSVINSKNYNKGIPGSYKPIRRYSGLLDKARKDQNEFISSPPETRISNPRTKFIP